MEVKAKIGKDGEPVAVNYPDADVTSVADLVKTYGEEIVVAHAKSSFVVALQGYMRGLLKSGKTPKEIQESVDKWKPGIRTPGKSKGERAADLVKQMDPAERKALLAQLKAAG